MQQKLKIVTKKVIVLFENIGTAILKYSYILWQIIQIKFQHLLIICKTHWPTIRERLEQYALLIRLDKPVGIFLLLWPTLWGLWIAAKGIPDVKVLIVFILGVILMRSAGCVLNDIADRKYDPHVSRTKMRPLASGRVSASEALIVALCLIFIAFLLVLTLNWLTVQLAFIAVMLAGIYPFMKRYTYLPQFFLGLTFGWSIPMAFAAQTGGVPQIAWLLLIANVLWSVVYDTMYAMVDKEDDLKIGVKSTAILFDDADRVIIAIIQSLVLVTLFMVGKQAQLGVGYYISLGIAACFFIYQLSLIWNRKPEHCMKAFLNNNWFGMTVFIGLVFNFIINNNV